LSIIRVTDFLERDAPASNDAGVLSGLSGLNFRPAPSIPRLFSRGLPLNHALVVDSAGFYRLLRQNAHY
jgi:hypothetical protein